MNTPPELTAAEQELNAARASFNIARLALNTTLSTVNAREGASDRIISHADEYGVDRTLSVLAKTPAVLDLPAVPQPALASIGQQLEHAYDANHRLDRALAARENLLRKDNPAHAKAINIGGRDMVFDDANDSLHERGSDAVIPAHATRVDPKGDMDSKTDKDQDR